MYVSVSVHIDEHVYVDEFRWMNICISMIHQYICIRVFVCLLLCVAEDADKCVCAH